MAENMKSTKMIYERIKKRILVLKFLAILGVAFFVTGLGMFFLWQNSIINRTPLDIPTNVIIVDQGDRIYLTFDEVMDANGYKVYINGELKESPIFTTQMDITNYLSTPGKYSVIVQALGGELRKNSEKSLEANYTVTKTLSAPMVELDEANNKLVWNSVLFADAYDIYMNDEGNKIAHTDNLEFDISDFLTDEGVQYSFWAVAVGGEFYNSSDKSNVLVRKLIGEMGLPTNIALDSNYKLSWNGTQGARDGYKVFLQYQDGEIKSIDVRGNECSLVDELNGIGSYSVYIQTKGYTSNNTEWIKSSSYSDSIQFIMPEQLQTPIINEPIIKATQVEFSWSAVPNALTYTVELLNGVGGEAYWTQDVYINSLTVGRNLAVGEDNIFILRVKAKGYGYYLDSEYSAESTPLNAEDQFEKVETIEMFSNRELYLSWAGVFESKDGIQNIRNHNGYLIYIFEMDNDGNLLDADGNIVEDIDTAEPMHQAITKAQNYVVTGLFTKPTRYAVYIKVLEYEFYNASEWSERYTYYNVLPLAKVGDFEISKEMLSTHFDLNGRDNEDILVLTWTGVEHAKDYNVYFYDTDPITIDPLSLNSVEIIDILNITTDADIECREWIDSITLKKKFAVNFSELFSYLRAKQMVEDVGASGTKNEALEQARAFHVKIKAVGELDANNCGYKDSALSDMKTYSNYVKLETPVISECKSTDEENLILFYNIIGNATNYSISIYNEMDIADANDDLDLLVSSVISQSNIYDYVMPGKNYIKVRAIGSGYYLSSDWSEIREVDFTAVLKAPIDLRVEETMEGEEPAYKLKFLPVKFATFYSLQILKGDGESFTDIYPSIENYQAQKNSMIIDITNFLKTNGFGKYTMRVKSCNPDAVNSVWSEFCIYKHVEKLASPSGLAFNVDTNCLTWDGVNFAEKYMISLAKNVNGNAFDEFTGPVGGTVFSIQDYLNTHDNYGSFIAKVKACVAETDELHVDSIWSDVLVFTVFLKLEKASNFEFNNLSNLATWSTDDKREYDSITIEYSNLSQSPKQIASVDNYLNKQYDLTELVATYGAGIYTFKITSFATSASVIESDEVEFIAYSLALLETPTLVSVSGKPKVENETDECEQVIAKFSTVKNAKTYSIYACILDANGNVLSLEGSNALGYKLVLGDVSANLGINGFIEVDIKNALKSVAGANYYKIVVVANGYQYFKESSYSNDKTFKLYSAHDAVTNLIVEKKTNGQVLLSFDPVASASVYTIILDSTIISSNYFTLSQEKVYVDVTVFFADKVAGYYEARVRGNAIGYYSNGLIASYLYTNAMQLSTPEIEFNAEEKRLLITPNMSAGLGYNIEITYPNNIQAELFEKVFSNNVDLSEILATNGLGEYSIRVQEVGDGVYLTSEWSELLTFDWVVRLPNLKNINVQKIENLEDISYEINYELNEELQNNAELSSALLVNYNVYNVEDLNSDLTLLEPVKTGYAKVNENFNFVIDYTGLVDNNYYVLGLNLMGGYDNGMLYEQEFNADVRERLQFFKDSEVSKVRLSTYGKQLNSPKILVTKIETRENVDYLDITFEAVSNAETYCLKVTRDLSQSVIYNEVAMAVGLNIVQNADLTLMVSVACAGGATFVDNFDGYIIELGAESVMQEEEELFKVSELTNYMYEHKMQLDAPNVTIQEVLSGLVFTMDESAVASGYLFKIEANGFVQTYLSDTRQLEKASPQLGEYKVWGKFIGDAYHIDSEFGAEYAYTYSQDLSAITELVVKDNAVIGVKATRIWATWETVANALAYEVKIDKVISGVWEQVDVLEVNTNLIELYTVLNNAGYGTYKISVKPKTNGFYFAPEDYASVSYEYYAILDKVQNIEVFWTETETEIHYFVKFLKVNNAVKYEINIYSAISNNVIKTFEINSEDCELEGETLVVNVDDEFADILGGNYFISMIAMSNGVFEESVESDKEEFIRWLKYTGADLNVFQEGQSEELKVTYYSVGALTYSLKINGNVYELEGQTSWAYRNNILVTVDQLIIGVQNEFKLTADTNESIFRRSTTFTKLLEDFSFKLAQPAGAVVSQNNQYHVADSEFNQILLTVPENKYAESYIVNIKLGSETIHNQIVLNVVDNKFEFDISSYFADLMPDEYKLEIKADNQYLEASSYAIISFNYILKFKQVNDVVIDTENYNLIATWTESENYTQYNELCETNEEDMNLSYVVGLYYESLHNQVINKTVNTKEFDLSDFTDKLLEPGEWILIIKVADIFEFKNNDENSSYIKIQFTINAPTNFTLTKSVDDVYVSWTDVVYTLNYANDINSIFYKIFINGNDIGLSYKNGAPAKKITDYLCGGKNVVYVKAFSNYPDYWLPSNRSNKQIYEHQEVFDAPQNFDVIASYENGAYKQFLTFDKIEKNGLLQTDIANLTYDMVMSKDGGEEVTTPNLRAFEKDGKFRIDITSIIHNTVGVYNIKLKVNEFRSQMVMVEGEEVVLVIGESSYATDEYIHVYYVREISSVSAKVFDIYADISDKQNYMNTQPLRDIANGIEMSSFLLYFEVTLPSEYLNDEDTHFLYFTIRENGVEFVIQMPNEMTFGDVNATRLPNSILGLDEKDIVTFGGLTLVDGKVFAVVEMIPLCEENYFQVEVPERFLINVKSNQQSYYAETTYTLTEFVYDYKLRFKSPTNVEVVDLSGKKYLKWDEHPNQYAVSYNLSIKSQGISLLNTTSVEIKFANYHGTKGTVYIIQDGQLIKDRSPELELRDGYYYVCLEDYLFAGYNDITLLVNANPLTSYIDSFPVVINSYEYYKQILSPVVSVENSLNNSVPSSNEKGIKIIVDANLFKDINYNKDNLYEIALSGNISGKNKSENCSTPDVIINYAELVAPIITDFKKSKQINIQYTYEGVVYNDKVRFECYESTTTIYWTLSLPGSYKVSVKALGQEKLYTLDSVAIEKEINLIYSVVSPTISVIAYNEAGQVRVGSTRQLSAMGKFVLAWTSPLQYYSNIEYVLQICRNDVLIKDYTLKNESYFICDELNHAELFQYVKDYPGLYQFRIISKSVHKLDKQIFYESEYGECEYSYYRQSGAVSDMQLVYMENTKQTYIRFLPEMLSNNLEIQNLMTYTIKVKQNDVSYNVNGQNQWVTVNLGQKASYYKETTVSKGETFEAGYCYYLVNSGSQARIYPGSNTVEIKLENAPSYFLIEGVEKCVKDLDMNKFYMAETKVALSIYSERLDNDINNQEYNCGITMDFDNVEFNKYFSYLINVNGTQYNPNFKRTFYIHNGNKVDIEVPTGFTLYEINVSDISTYNIENVCKFSKRIVNKNNFYTLNILNSGNADEYEISIVTLGDNVNTLNSNEVQHQFIMRGTLLTPHVSLNENYTDLNFSAQSGSDSIITVIIDEFNAQYYSLKFRKNGGAWSTINDIVQVINNSDIVFGGAYSNQNMELQKVVRDGKIIGFTIDLWKILYRTAESSKYFSSKGIWDFSVVATNAEKIASKNILRYEKKDVSSVELSVTLYRCFQQVEISTINHTLTKIDGVTKYQTTDYKITNSTELQNWYGEARQTPYLQIQYAKADNNYQRIGDFIDLQSPVLLSAFASKQFVVENDYIKEIMNKIQSVVLGNYALRFYVIGKNSTITSDAIWLSEPTFTKNKVWEVGSAYNYVYRANLICPDFNANTVQNKLDASDANMAFGDSSYAGTKYVAAEYKYDKGIAYKIDLTYKFTEYPAFVGNKNIIVKFEMLKASGVNNISETPIEQYIEVNQKIDNKFDIIEKLNLAGFEEGHYLFKMQAIDMENNQNQEWILESKVEYFAVTILEKFNMSFTGALVGGIHGESEGDANKDHDCTFLNEVRFAYNGYLGITSEYPEGTKIIGSVTSSSANKTTFSDITLSNGIDYSADLAKEIKLIGTYSLEAKIIPCESTYKKGTFGYYMTTYFKAESDVTSLVSRRVKAKIIIDSYSISASNNIKNKITMNIACSDTQGYTVKIDNLALRLSADAKIRDTSGWSNIRGNKSNLESIMTSYFKNFSDNGLFYPGKYDFTLYATINSGNDYIESDASQIFNKKFVYQIGYEEWTMSKQNGAFASNYLNGKYANMNMKGQITAFEAPLIQDSKGAVLPFVNYSFIVDERSNVVGASKNFPINLGEGTVNNSSKKVSSTTIRDADFYVNTEREPGKDEATTCVHYNSVDDTNSKYTYYVKLKLSLNSNNIINNTESYFDFPEEQYFSHDTKHGYYGERRLPKPSGVISDSNYIDNGIWDPIKDREDWYYWNKNWPSGVSVDTHIEALICNAEYFGFMSVVGYLIFAGTSPYFYIPGGVFVWVGQEIGNYFAGNNSHEDSETVSNGDKVKFYWNNSANCHTHFGMIQHLSHDVRYANSAAIGRAWKSGGGDDERVVW